MPHAGDRRRPRGRAATAQLRELAQASHDAERVFCRQHADRTRLAFPARQPPAQPAGEGPLEHCLGLGAVQRQGRQARRAWRGVNGQAQAGQLGCVFQQEAGIGQGGGLELGLRLGDVRKTLFDGLAHRVLGIQFRFLLEEADLDDGAVLPHDLVRRDELVRALAKVPRALSARMRKAFECSFEPR